MPRRWSKGLDRSLSDGLDGDVDRALKENSAHQRHDTDRSSKRPAGDTSGPSCDSASAPKKRGWFS
ncbi:hypothetical protein [Streptomyces sp. NPDC058644]|uniref:hypothetical protein n=1 Tax=unclassified Streptomyces TaxID=2593676 RepID=UPI003668123E